MVVLTFDVTRYPPSLQGELIAGALALASRGWPVFPCRADKRPATGRGFYDASTEPAQIKAMFEQPGAALIGIPTGEPSGLVAIDVDVHEESDGTAWYEENINSLPATLTHGTLKGGCHLIFKKPHGVSIKNSAGLLAKGVDVRGDGGYIIAPPSPGYETLSDVPPADMPDWLIRTCLKQNSPPALPLPAPHAAPLDRLGKWAAAALTAECEAVMRAAEGTRNNQLNVSAVKLGSIVGGGALSRPMVEAELTRAAQMAGLDATETAATIRSGIEHGLRSPRSVPDRESPNARRESYTVADRQQAQPRRALLPLVYAKDMQPRLLAGGTLVSALTAVTRGLLI